MYKLFSTLYDGNASVIKPPEFEYIKRTYQRELQKLMDYFHTRVYAVKSNHLLCRILTSTSLPLEYDVDRFMEAVYARSPYVAKHFNFTNDINFGKVHHGVFYGEGNFEIILSNEDYFNPFEAYLNWKNCEAVKILDHNVSDLGLLLPDGKQSDTAQGLNSITVNLPMLFLQFKAFMNREYLRYEEGSDSVLGVTHFVNMYVLPNMLKSHLEIVLLNRLMNLYYGVPMSEPLKHLPFPIVDYKDKIDKVLGKVLNHIEDNRMLYYVTLKNIPSVSYTDMQEFLLMPDLTKTRQAWWAMFLSRFKIINFLIDIGGSEGIRNNFAYINRLKIDVKELNRSNLLKSYIPIDLLFDIEENFKKILAL